MTGWLAEQGRTLFAASRRLLHAPLSTLFNVSVLGLALALPAALYVGLANLQNAARAAAPEPQLTLFMALDATPAQVREIDTRLKQHEQVGELRYLPRDEALREIERSTGMGGIAQGLGRNPLPDAFVVNARDTSAAALERLRAEIAGWPKVALVALDSAWAQRLDALLRLARLALLLLGTALAFALVTVTFNTIRLQILTQREEIEVAGLIGATARFIRRPFLYHGALLGLLAGLVAWALIALATAVLSGAVENLARLYGANWRPGPLSLRDAFSLLAFATVLGWIGAWLSVARHLAATQAR